LLAFGFFNPLGQFYARHLIHWQESENLKNATNIVLALRFIAILLSLPLALFIFYLFDYQRYFSLLEYIIYITFALVALTHGMLLSAVNILVSRVVFTVYTVVTLALGLASSLVIFQFNQTAMGWLYGLALVQILTSVSLYRRIVTGSDFSLTRVKFSLNKNYIKNTLIFILPVTITLFLQWGQMASFRLIVEDLYSIEDLAFIAIGMAISGAIFSSIESLAVQFYMPLYLKRITNASLTTRANAWNELANIIIPIYAGVALFVGVFSPYLVKILVAEEFYNAYIYTMIGATIELFRASSNLVYQVSQSELNTKKTILPYLLGFGVMLIGLYSIDASESLWKVPAIIATSYLVTLCIMYGKMRALLAIRVDWRLLMKTLFFSLPMMIVFLLNIDKNFMNSFFITIFGGIYLITVLYFLLSGKIKSMKVI